MALQTWKDAYAAAKAGTGRANVLTVGDSYMEGQGADGRSGRFVDLIIAGLRSAHGITGGVGWMRPRWSSQQAGASWPASIGTGTGSNSENYQCGHGFSLAVNQYREWTVQGDSFDLVTPQGTGGNGTMTVAVNGATVDSFSQAGTLTYAKVRHYTLGASGSYTIRVTSTTGTCALDGIQVFDGDYEAGISLWECSKGAQSSKIFQPESGASQGWVNADIHLVIDSLYGNDYLAPSDGTTFTPALAASRATARWQRYKALPNSPHIITYVLWGLASYPGPNAYGFTGAQYNQAIKDAAATEGGIQVVDFTERHAVAPAGMLKTDNVHPNAAGHAEIADMLLDAIPGPTTTEPPVGPWRIRQSGLWVPVTARRRTSGSWTTVNTARGTGTPPVDPPDPPDPPQGVFGPTGTHWPTHTLLPGQATTVVEVAATWSAIKTAINAVTAPQAAAGVEIRVQPGNMHTNTGVDAIADAGSASWDKNVLVIPRDGWGTVTCTGDTRTRRVKGVTFARINAEFVGLRDSSRTVWAQSKLVKGAGANFGLRMYATGEDVTECGAYEVVAPEMLLTEQDVFAYTADAGRVITDSTWAGCYAASCYRAVGSASHLDTWQAFGNGWYRGIYMKDCVLFGSHNCALQLGGTNASDPNAGTPFLTLDHTLLVSQRDAHGTRYPAPPGAELPPLTQVINGAGDPGELNSINGTVVIGTLYTTSWDTVTDSTTSAPNAPINNPAVVGGWVYDPALASLTNAMLDEWAPVPSDVYLASIWS